jgi:hypothetical protein
MLTVLITVHEHPYSESNASSLTSQVVTFDNEQEYNTAKANLAQTYSGQTVTVYTTVLRRS